MKLPLSNNSACARISPEDGELLRYTWKLHQGYAYAYVAELKDNISLHRMVVLRQGIVSTTKTPIEHLNHDKLDCRRENLMPSTASANHIRNPCKGYHKPNNRNYWSVWVTYQKHKIHLGQCASEELAAALASLARERLLQLIAENEQLTLNQVKHFFNRKGNKS